LTVSNDFATSPRRRVRGEQDAHDQCTEIPLDPDRLEQGVTGQQGHRKTEQGLHLSVADVIPQAAKAPRRRNEQHQRQGPRTGRLALRGHQEDHGGDVLHHEDSDGEPAVQRLCITALVKDLHGEDRRGERQRERHQRQRPHAFPREEMEADCREEAEERSRGDDARRRVRHRGQPDRAAQQKPHVQFEADAEEQERDPEVGEHLQTGRFLKSGRVQAEAGGEEADQGRQACQPRHHTGGQGSGEHGEEGGQDELRRRSRAIPTLSRGRALLGADGSLVADASLGAHAFLGADTSLRSAPERRWGALGHHNREPAPQPPARRRPSDQPASQHHTACRSRRSSSGRRAVQLAVRSASCVWRWLSST